MRRCSKQGTYFTAWKVFDNQPVTAPVTSLLTVLSLSDPYSDGSPVTAGTSRWLTPRTTTTSTDFDLLSVVARLLN